MQEEPVAPVAAVEAAVGGSTRSALAMTIYWMRDLLFSVVIAIVIILFLYQPVKVEGTSMMPSLVDQERIFINKFVYRFGLGEIARGDTVVFYYPSDPTKSYIKRVIGLPGDRLRIDAKQVYLNGRALEEPYKVHGTPYLEPYRDTFPAPPNRHVERPAVRMLAENVKGGELVVPAGMYFALGDNRDNSLDSRYWGFVPRESIIGKPLFIYWSFEQPAFDGSRSTSEHLLDVAANFFSRTRWNRTFMLVRAHPIGY